MRSRILPIATFAAIAALALTGCATGSEAPSQSQSVFEFQTPRFGSDSGELTVRVPEGLIEAAGGEAGELLVASAKITHRELDSSKLCAFDVAPEYTDGISSLSGPSITAAQADAKAEADVERFLAAFDATSVDGAVKYIEDLMSKPDFNAYYGEGNWAAALNQNSDSDWVSMLFEHANAGLEPRAAFEATISDIESSYEKKAADAASLSAAAMLGERLTGLSAASATASARAIGDLDTSSPEEGFYVAEDGSSLTYVQPCAVSAMEDSTSDSFQFPIETADGITTLATVELTVMKSGTLTVTSAEVNGFTRDTDGNWIGN